MIRGLLWPGALLGLLIALGGKNPYLIVLRDFQWPLVLVLGTGVLMTLARTSLAGRLGRAERVALAGFALLAMLMVTREEIEFRCQRSQVLAADVVTRQLGRHFMVGYRNFDEVSVLAERGLIGGIYLSRKNVRDRTAAQLRAEIDALQRLRQRANLPRLLVAADQEGGSVAHMSPPLAPQPALATLVSGGTDHSLESRARAYGVAQGQGLAAMGINMNFGPVVDLLPRGKRLMFDTHTLLGKRAISSDPVVVTRVASAYADGLMSQGVQPTLKHFPGLARVTVDTHHVAGQLQAARHDLAANDWRPFRALSATGAALMVGHVVLNDIDPTTPASLSGAVIQGLLRKEWGFQGVIVSDDLNMGAVYRLGIGQAASAALKAGVDLVLISYDPDQYYRAMTSAVAAYRANELDDVQLQESKRRLDQALHGGVGDTPL